MSTLTRHYHEKRDFIRMQMAAPATLTLSDGTAYQLTCVDLSSSGVQLHHHQALPIGQTATLRINSGGGATSALAAKVTIQRINQLRPGLFSIGLSIDTFI